MFMITIDESVIFQKNLSFDLIRFWETIFFFYQTGNWIIKLTFAHSNGFESLI